MKVLGVFEDPACRGWFFAIGNFDGVHLGHRAMLAQLRKRANAAGAPAVVLTFEPHPIAILRPAQAPALLTTLERKLELLEAAGVDCTIAYPTDRALLDLSARAFFDDIIAGRLATRGLVEGTNFQFGKGRAGTVDLLRDWCRTAGIACDILPPVSVDNRLVSSSEIRGAIARGDVAEAALLLGAPYRISGTVVRGESRGASIGFPTANLDRVATLLPAHGVYAGRARCDDGWFAAAINLGPNPTFGEAARKFEAHLLDYAGNLYGQHVEVEFVAWLRNTQAFAGVEHLIEQLKKDVARTQALVNGALDG
ncbi:MAG: bifunctional riboflavin kinase/FAD synthetase [Planctomycetaceae bacterium]|nr:MAG: bifunctional riboflavin kinase/FAD synthetase [Planctomycetaceae bacterium]